jgi:hypothetical protein
MIARAICRSSLRSSPIKGRQSYGAGRAAGASLSWPVGGCPALRSSAARRSRTSATSEARIGADGWGNRAAALFRPRLSANTLTPSHARRQNGSRLMRNGRCSPSPVYGRRGAACAVPRARQLASNAVEHVRRPAVRACATSTGDDRNADGVAEKWVSPTEIVRSRYAHSGPSRRKGSARLPQTLADGEVDRPIYRPAMVWRPSASPSWFVRRPVRPFRWRPKSPRIA